MSIVKMTVFFKIPHYLQNIYIVYTVFICAKSKKCLKVIIDNEENMKFIPSVNTYLTFMC